MYRGLVESEPQSGEEDYAFQFESPHFVTLGLLYEENKRFAGGAFAPMLRRVDKFLKGTFPEGAGRSARRARIWSARRTPRPRRRRREAQEAGDQPTRT